jgi:hypothetical protein
MREKIMATAKKDKLIYESLEELISPETLSELEGRRVATVQVAPFEPVQSATQNPLLSVSTPGSAGRGYVVKRMSLEWDWIMEATGDNRCREVQLWRSGILDRLPESMCHAIVACAADGPGWAIMMRDYSDSFSRVHALTEGMNAAYLEAMAALHARFLDDDELKNSTLGLCEPSIYYTFLSPRRSRAVWTPILSHLLDGWEVLETLWDRATIHVIEQLHADPDPLCDALGRFPQTLVHGDEKFNNLAVLSESAPAVLVIDWQFATRMAPAVGLARYLCTPATAPPVAREISLDYYRACFERCAGFPLDDREWQTQVDLAFLGSVLWAGSLLALKAVTDERVRAELPWWEQRVHAGADRL